MPGAQMPLKSRLETMVGKPGPASGLGEGPGFRAPSGWQAGGAEPKHIAAAQVRVTGAAEAWDPRALCGVRYGK